MAKKQTMNLLEANFEKIIVAVAVAFIGWVVYSNLLNAPGVEVAGQKKSATEAAEEGAQVARRVVDNLINPGALDEHAIYEPVGDNVMANIKPVEMKKTIIFPPDIRRLILEQDIRNYVMPDQPGLSDPKIMLTHAQASVPVQLEIDDDTPMAAGGFGRTSSYEIQDVTFVTVEATIDMKQLYEEFENAFTGPRVQKKMEKDEMYQPVVASVDLVRKELLADGSWSEPVYVPRLANDPMKNSFTFEELTQMSKTKHEISMKDNMSASTQLMMLQPRPYELVGDKWLNPTAREEAGDDDDRRGRTTPGGMGGGMPAMGLGGGLGIMGNQNTSQLRVSDLQVWAHDETVEPGKIYSYAIKVSFYNPCFNTNWLDKSNQQWKLSQVFPTSMAVPENPVLTPPDSLFIPRAINDENTARVDIYKYQKGQWFKRSFSVAPGSSVGYPVNQQAYVSSRTATTMNPGMMGMPGGMMGEGGRPALTETEDESEIEVDFGVGATVLEIKKPSTRWYKTSNGMRSALCGEIVYCDEDGETKSVTTQQEFWSETFREMFTSVNRAYTADERKRRDQARENRNNAGRR